LVRFHLGQPHSDSTNVWPTVYALDRLPEPSENFHNIAERAKELGTSLEYRQIDVRDVEGLNKIVEEIGSKHGRLDGLIAAAGIQQETPALEYTAEDANHMFAVNITGVFMTAQAAAKQMIKFGNGGSIVMIGSMSATVANKVNQVFFLMGVVVTDTYCRALFAPPTMPRKPVWYSLGGIWRPNGANTRFGSIPSLQDIL
jgi:NAD(P)-dependent dehydrogenase (short-subunit alcohol dehydrogenase family)